MSNQTIEAPPQAGFTLVELAIVMIIIGLLIAGVLKGQALISNAQVAAAVSQLKGVDAATTSFRDAYQYMPGDLPSPTTRLPGCTTANVCGKGTTGNGDGILTGNVPGAAPATESLIFFPQPAAASLLTGINFQAAACTGTWGDCYPAARIGGGLNPGWSNGTTAFIGAVGTPTSFQSGVFMALAQTAGAAMATTAGSVPLTPNQAKRMDDKMDDGHSNDWHCLGWRSRNMHYRNRRRSHLSGNADDQGLRPVR